MSMIPLPFLTMNVNNQFERRKKKQGPFWELKKAGLDVGGL